MPLLRLLPIGGATGGSVDGIVPRLRTLCWSGFSTGTVYRVWFRGCGLMVVILWSNGYQWGSSAGAASAFGVFVQRCGQWDCFDKSMHMFMKDRTGPTPGEVFVDNMLRMSR